MNVEFSTKVSFIKPSCGSCYGPVPGNLVFGHIESVKILVILNPTGYMLTSSGFDAFIHLRYVL